MAIQTHNPTCNSLFRKASRSQNEIDMSRYRKLRNRIIKTMRNSKRNYFHNLVDSNTKDFLKIVKTLKNKTTTPVLKLGNLTAERDSEEAQMLNTFLLSVGTLVRSQSKRNPINVMILQLMTVLESHLRRSFPSLTNLTSIKPVALIVYLPTC